MAKKIQLLLIKLDNKYKLQYLWVNPLNYNNKLKFIMKFNIYK